MTNDAVGQSLRQGDGRPDRQRQGADDRRRLRAALEAVLAETDTPPAPEGATLFPPGSGIGHAALGRDLRAGLEALRAGRGADPFSNPIQLLALRLSRRIDAGEVSFSDLEQLIQCLTTDAFLAGAERLADRMGETDPAANARIVRALITDLTRDPAGSGATAPFETFRAAVERALFGIVFTAHPTFAFSAQLLRIQAQLATDHDDRGRRFSAADRAALVRRVLAAEHRPEPVIDLATEHAFSLIAIDGARDALIRVYEIVFEVARETWPERWLELRPRLLTIASWVGYDLDGRADIGWPETFHRRLIVRMRQLVHYRDTAVALGGALGSIPEAETLRHILELLESRLDLAVRTVEEEIEVFGRPEPDPARRAGHVGRIARRMYDGREGRLTRAGPLIELVERAIARAAEIDGDPAVAAVLVRLAVLRAELANFGLGAAHTHVRLNATQIHNAVRREIGMESAPDDPSRRRSYTAAVNALLDTVEPATINFGSLLNEGASGTRLMMVVAQMLKYVDATTPVRFLVAECETSFTLLAVLYLAKLFGIADRVEISPLFETRKALERGPRVIDELLANPHYRAYVEGIGRLCVQTGYSDTGRNLGQTVAGASVERMRMRIGEAFAHHDLRHVELLIFDTHGESIGRGAHPASFGDRLRYVSPPESRRRFARDGIAFKQETSFQGGDGYVWFFSPAAAFASVTRILEFALTPPDEDGDPFYDEADYVAEFFTTIQFFYDAVLHDPGYATLLGAFGTHMTYPAGSRSLRRQHDPGTTADLAHPSQLRAIPHNATLQQLGYLANTLAGAGQAIRKNPAAFRAMYDASPRFRRVFGLIAWALAFSDSDVLKAYVDTLDPGLWLLRMAQTRIGRERFDELRAIGGFIEEHAHHDRLSGILRTLERDLFDMLHALAAPDGGKGIVDETIEAGVPRTVTEDLRLLHVIRIALIQRIFMLATHIPEFSLRHELSPEELRARILRLDVGEALEALHTIFPQDSHTGRPEDFGEPATYETDTGQSYAREHAHIFQPMGKLYELVRRTGSGINHIIGAIG